MFESSIERIPDVFLKVPLVNFVLLATMLFVIGIVGVLIRKNAIIIFMSIELMLNAVNMLLIAFSSYKSNLCLLYHGSCCSGGGRRTRYHCNDIQKYQNY